MTAQKRKDTLAREQGIFCEKLKTGLIFPIHKEETKSASSNYCLTSILPLFSKTFAKLVIQD